MEISEKRQKLIGAKNNSPLEVGENVLVKYNAVHNYVDAKRENQTIFCAILKIDTQITVRHSDNSVYKDTFKISLADISSRDLSKIGVNPFDIKSDHVRTVAFSFDSIIHNLRILPTVSEIGGPYLFDGIEAGRLNWNPFVYNKSGEKEYYQRPFVWKLSDKQLLVESVYRGIDCGKILVRKREWSELEKMRANGETEIFFNDIVDGKQRLDAMRGFLLSEYPDIHGNYWGDLSFDSQNRFKNHQLFSYAELPGNSKDEDIIHQFLKLNFTGVPQSKEHIEFVKSLKNKF